jgi:hypothetical protein
MRTVVKIALAGLAAAVPAAFAHAGTTAAASMDAVTNKSGHAATANAPNVTKMPGPPAPFVPIPYPNMGMKDKGSDAQKKVKEAPVQTKNSSTYKQTTGDEAGTLKGVASSKKMKGTQNMGGPKAKLEGKKPVMLLTPIDSDAKVFGRTGSANANAPTGLPPAADSKPEAQETYRKVNLERRVVTSEEIRPKDPVLAPLQPVAPGTAPSRAVPQLPPPALTPIAAPKIQPAPIPLRPVPLPVTQVEPVKVPQPVVAIPVQSTPTITLQPRTVK